MEEGVEIGRAELEVLKKRNAELEELLKEKEPE